MIAGSASSSSSMSHSMHWHSTPAGYRPTPHASSLQRTHVRSASSPHSGLGSSGVSSITESTAMSARPQSPRTRSRSRSSTNGGWHASAQDSASTRTAARASLAFSTRSGRHAVSDSAPSVSEYLPDTHAVHAEAPGDSANVPRRHAVHVCDPKTALNVPGAQEVHSTPEDVYPASHSQFASAVVPASELEKSGHFMQRFAEDAPSTVE